MRALRLSRPLAIALSTCAALGLLAVGITPAHAAPGDVAIDVYSMNDFHGRLETTSSTAGAAVIAGAFKGFQAANPNSTLVAAGDNVGASTFTSLVQEDNPTIDALNAIGLSVTAIGNHELDKGTADLDGHIIPRADYEHISANLLKAGTNEHAYAPYDVQEFDGVKVGFIGAVTEDLPYLVSPAGIATLDVAPIVSSVNAVASNLKDGNPANGEADILILLIHEGAATSDSDVTDPNTVFGKIVLGTGPNLDAIASGHTHVAYNHLVDVGGPRPLPVLETGSYGTNLGHFAITADPTTHELTSINGQLIPLLDASQAPAFPADPTVQAIVDEAVAVAKEKGQISIGSITALLNRAVQSDGAENRGGESTLSNLVADAQLWATSELDTQIAFMNPGGIRQNISFASAGAGDADGNVSYQEAAIVQPFANTLITQTLTGAQVKTVLEQQWQPVGTSRPFLKLGTNKELSYTYDPAAAAGSKITGVYLNGIAIAAEDTFTVVANSFLGSGGDNFTELSAGANKADSGRVDLQAFVDYLSQNSPITPDSATRSIGISGAPTTLAAGSPFSAALSSLVLSTAPVKDSLVAISFDGKPIASAPIDTSIVDTTDEQGRAAVSFTIPKNTTPGTHTVSFTLAETGVQLDVDIQVTAVVGGFEGPEPGTTPGGQLPTPAAGNPAGTPPAATLAATGLPIAVPIGAGLVLLAAGIVLLGSRRRTVAASQ